jgi:hypothetical protein
MFLLFTVTGMLVALDAKTMKELGRAKSPELMPFGFHSRFIARDTNITVPVPSDVTPTNQPPCNVNSAGALSPSLVMYSVWFLLYQLIN